MLTLTDSYFPGWRASVDGKPIPVSATEQGLRYVEVRAGDHTVEFRYEPATYRVGLFVSLLALAGLLGFGAACSVFSRSRAATTAL